MADPTDSQLVDMFMPPRRSPRRAPPAADPTEAHRLFAADARAMFTALTDEGFTEDQAVGLLCQLIGQQPAQPPRSDRRGQVESLLAAAGKKSPATRSSVEDRSAELWNPPAPEGAPAHE